MSITKKMKRIATKNGINDNVLRGRLRMGWDTETAITKPVVKRRPRYKGDYAIYRDDEIIAMGTAEECAEKLGATVEYIKWMTTPSGQKRLDNRKSPDKTTRAVRLDE